MKFFWLAIIMMLFSFNVSATVSENSGWIGTFSKKEITENYHSWIEGQMRYSFERGGANQILFRTGVLQKLSEGQGLGYLYAYIQSGTQKEHRLTLQHTQKYGHWLASSFSHRARLEGRFLEDSDEDAGRFRYLIRSEKELISCPSLVVWNEVFVHLTQNSWTGDNAFDRNRFFLGTKVKVFNARAELGYMNQYVHRAAGDISEHIATVYWFF